MIREKEEHLAWMDVLVWMESLAHQDHLGKEYLKFLQICLNLIICYFNLIQNVGSFDMFSVCREILVNRETQEEM